MIAGRPSRTAIAAAEARASHRFLDPPPWLVDDPYAVTFAGSDFAPIAAESLATAGAAYARRGRAGVATRARWVEDRLLNGALHSTSFSALASTRSRGDVPIWSVPLALRRYFTGRTDRLRPLMLERLLSARVG